MILGSLLILSSLFALSLVIILFFQPRWIFFLTNLFVPGVIYFAETEKLLLALTIDDGPDPITTPKILNTLERYGAHATFFLISNRVKGNEELLKRMVNDGHELGNHLPEDRPSILLSPEAFESELIEAHQVFSQFSQLRWLRPASGWYNNAMVKIASLHHYQIVLGSIFPFDTHISSVWFSAQHILINAAPGGIIVLHNHGSWGKRTALTLQNVLPKLAKKGYQIVSLSELIPE
jgi:peptidoglycan/xylan/chitin deacetylase (PgdA/CDA1 family)